MSVEAHKVQMVQFPGSVAKADAVTWVTRLVWRWFTLFVLFYMFFGEDGLNTDMGDRGFPVILPLIKWYDQLLFGTWNALVPWLGHLVGYPIVASRLDTVFDWTIVAILSGSALLISIIWTVADRDRPGGETLYGVTRVLARYNLAGIMFNYGFLKTFHGQFPYPALAQLMAPVGNLTPTDLMWVFMGYSTLYDSLAEIGEVIGGILLLFRRTTTLGAIIVIGIMANVVMMNTSYLVDNRIFAGFYMLLAAYLLVPVAQRLLSAILGNETLPATVPALRTWPKPWMQWASVVIKIVVIACLFFTPLVRAIAHGQATAEAKAMPLGGLYQVREFRSTPVPKGGNGDSTVWTRVSIEGQPSDWVSNKTYPYVMAVRTPNDSMQYYALHLDRTTPTQGTLDLAKCHDYYCAIWPPLPDHPLRQAVLHYTIGPDTNQKSEIPLQPNELTIRGTIHGKVLSMRLQRIDPSTFVLVRSPFYVVRPGN